MNGAKLKCVKMIPVELYKDSLDRAGSIRY